MAIKTNLHKSLSMHPSDVNCILKSTIQDFEVLLECDVVLELINFYESTVFELGTYYESGGMLYYRLLYSESLDKPLDDVKCDYCEYDIAIDDPIFEMESHYPETTIHFHIDCYHDFINDLKCIVSENTELYVLNEL